MTETGQRLLAEAQAMLAHAEGAERRRQWKAKDWRIHVVCAGQRRLRPRLAVRRPRAASHEKRADVDIGVS